MMSYTSTLVEYGGDAGGLDLSIQRNQTIHFHKGNINHVYLQPPKEGSEKNIH
jgi:hypothetical protein